MNHRWSTSASLKADEKPTIGGSVNVTISGTNSQAVDDMVVDTEAEEFSVAFSAAECVSLMMVSDQIVTIKTNDAGTPAQTFELNANQPMFWYQGMSGASPITVDVTSLIVDNQSGSDARVQCEFLIQSVAA